MLAEVAYHAGAKMSDKGFLCPRCNDDPHRPSLYLSFYPTQTPRGAWVCSKACKRFNSLQKGQHSLQELSRLAVRQSISKCNVFSAVSKLENYPVVLKKIICLEDCQAAWDLEKKASQTLFPKLSVSIPPRSKSYHVTHKIKNHVAWDIILRS